MNDQDRMKAIRELSTRLSWAAEQCPVGAVITAVAHEGDDRYSHLGSSSYTEPVPINRIVDGYIDLLLDSTVEALRNQLEDPDDQDPMLEIELVQEAKQMLLDYTKESLGVSKEAQP